jgi:glyoxylase-like metal-dependent hydrolase (beta-lactamase superfamily II)/rhodanese-related sulfurtransferase
MSDQFPDLQAGVREISASELKSRLDAGEHVTILDTRRPADFEAWTLTHPNVTNVNVPFTEFVDDGEPAEGVPDGVPDGPLVTCCAKGISSLYVAEFLAQAGWEVEALDDGMRGWARLYEAREVEGAGSRPGERDGETTVLQYHRPSSGCLAYLVVSGEDAAVIDPLRAFATRYAEDAAERGATLRYAIDTHVHADHVSGVRDVARLTAAEPVLPEGAVDRGLDFDATLLGDGDVVEVGDASIEAVAIPGHTSEMTGYRVGDVFVTGDTLFTDSVARPDLEAGAEGAAEAAGRLYGTLQAVAEMPEETVIAPAHTSPGEEPAADGTYTARLGDLRESLGAFEQDREAFVEEITAEMPPRPNNFEEIIATNLGRTAVDDEEAFELELGPNNCAAAPSAD